MLTTENTNDTDNKKDEHDKTSFSSESKNVTQDNTKEQKVNHEDDTDNTNDNNEETVVSNMDEDDTEDKTEVNEERLDTNEAEEPNEETTEESDNESVTMT